MSDVSNDYIKKLNDIEIFYKQRNIGISNTMLNHNLDLPSHVMALA